MEGGPAGWSALALRGEAGWWLLERGAVVSAALRAFWARHTSMDKHVKYVDIQSLVCPYACLTCQNALYPYQEKQSAPGMRPKTRK